jgi:hypothetical protein
LVAARAGVHWKQRVESGQSCPLESEARARSREHRRAWPSTAQTSAPSRRRTGRYRAHFDLREEGVGGRDPDVSCKQQLDPGSDDATLSGAIIER